MVGVVTVVIMKDTANCGTVPCNLVEIYTSSHLLLCVTGIAESNQWLFVSYDGIEDHTLLSKTGDLNV
jgi:hypothetical protein